MVVVLFYIASAVSKGRKVTLDEVRGENSSQWEQQTQRRQGGTGTRSACLKEATPLLSWGPGLRQEALRSHRCQARSWIAS